MARSDNVSWQEYGYLKLDAISETSLANRSKFNFTKITPTKFIKVSKLVAKEECVVAECGLSMTTIEGDEVIISTASAPGAVSVKAEFYNGKYEPEFAHDDLDVVPI